MMNAHIGTRENAIFVRTDTRHSVERPESILQINMDFTRDDNGWAGECPELGVGTGYSKTIEQAREELNDIVMLYLNENDRMGQLDAVLEGKHVMIHRLDNLRAGPGGEANNIKPAPGRLS